VLLKAEAPIDLTELAIETLDNNSHEAKADEPIEVTELGMVISDNEPHEAKADEPIAVIRSDNDTVETPEPWNADAPIANSQPSNTTSFREVQPTNADEPREATVDGMAILFNALQRAYAYYVYL
jgi:hypothetical protein